jgi:hypothetical protein
LEKTDADFVDIVHSNMGSLLIGHVGCEQNLGHVDFYPNGGAVQPGCPNPILGTIEDIFSKNHDTVFSVFKRFAYTQMYYKRCQIDE